MEESRPILPTNKLKREYGCCDPRRCATMSGQQRLQIMRGIFGVFTICAALTTLVQFGIYMDINNFPGANIQLKTYQNGSRVGEYEQILGGFLLNISDECSNFIKKTPTSQKLCVASGGHNASANVNYEWSDGWVVAPNCARTDNQADCAYFGSNQFLAWSGFSTFALLTVQVLLYGIHTLLALDAGAAFQSAITSVSLFYREAKANELAVSKTGAYIGLTVVWMLIGMGLMGTSALAWDSFCDKMDTGLGRRVGNPYGVAPPACGTDKCALSFGSFVSTMAFALVWYRLPDIVQWFDEGLTPADK